MREADKTSLKPPATSDALGRAKNMVIFEWVRNLVDHHFPKISMCHQFCIGLSCPMSQPSQPSQPKKNRRIHRIRWPNPSASETGKAISLTFPLDLLSASSKRLLRTWSGALVATRDRTRNTRIGNWIGCCYQGTKFWIWMVLGSNEEGTLW